MFGWAIPESVLCMFSRSVYICPSFIGVFFHPAIFAFVTLYNDGDAQMVKNKLFSQCISPFETCYAIFGFPSYWESTMRAVICAGYERMIGSRLRFPERPTHLYMNSEVHTG